LTEKERRELLDSFASDAPQPNPIDKALRECEGPSGLEASVVALLDEKTSLLKTRLIIVLCFVPVVFFGMLALGAHGIRTALQERTSYWLAPVKRLSGVLVRQWKPPMTLAEARYRLRSWRPIFGIVYLAVFVGTIIAATVGLYGIALFANGVSNTRCSALTIVDWVFNGYGKFSGISTVLSEVDDLVIGLSKNSKFWRLYARLIEEMQELPEHLNLLKGSLEAISERRRWVDYSTGLPGKYPSNWTFCPSVDINVVRGAKDVLGWGIATALNLILQEVSEPLNWLQNSAAGFQSVLDDFRKQVAIIEKAVLEGFLIFQQADPVSAANDLVYGLLTGLIVMVLSLLPTFIVSLVVVLRFTRVRFCKRFGGSQDALPADPASPPSVAMDYDEDKLPTDAREWDQEAWLRPRGTLFTWTSALVYGSLAFGVSC
jgi:hypothetical protein